MKTLTVPVADETFERLKEVARPEQVHPRMQAAAILAGLLSDDEGQVLAQVYRLLGRIAARGTSPTQPTDAVVVGTRSPVPFGQSSPSDQSE